MTTTKRSTFYDWRRVAAAARAHPGIWLDLPAELPLLNGQRVWLGGYTNAFPTGCFEVKGQRRGEQRIRFIGDVVDYGDYSELDRRIRRVTIEAWYEHGIARPGYTVLPPARGYVAPLRLEESDLGVDASMPDVPTIAEGGRSHWPAIAETLRERPGEWHRILGKWATYAPQIRRGTLVAFRPVGEWEARTRDYGLEVRYVGTSDEATS